MNKFKSIIIENLFGSFTHKITLSKDSNITMILGRNGLGKTVVLKIIKAIFNGDLFQLESIEFSTIIIYFDDDNKWIITKNNLESDFLHEHPNELESVNTFFNIDLSYYHKEIFVDKLNIVEINQSFNRLKRILHRHLPPAIRTLDNDEWLDRRTEERFTTKQLIEKFGNVLPKSILQEYVIYPEWFNTRINEEKVSIIETQRLLTLSNDNDDYRYRDSTKNIYKNTVEEYSENLGYLIKSQLAKGSELSNELDRSYPNRLIERLKTGSKISQIDLNDSLKELEHKREKLQKVGLIDLQNQPNINSINRTAGDQIFQVLQVYIEDSWKKLEDYDSLANRIELFINIINDRFLQKKIYVSRNKGFYFKSIKTDNEIPLKSLSSGEQHIIVLYYELMFKIQENSLLLMDEPEISLHIAWQKKIIEDLKNIVKLKPLEIIIATHSPAVIGKNWDLTIELNEN